MDSILLSSSIHGSFLFPPRSSLRLPLADSSTAPRRSIPKASFCASNASPASSVPAHGPLSRALRSASCSVVLLATLISAGLRTPPALADASAVAAATEERVDPPSAEAADGAEAEVVAPLAQLLESNSKAVAALRTMLYQNLEEGEDAEALEILNRLMAAQPDAAEWKLLAARLNADIGEAAESRRLFEEVLEVDPLSFEALFENAVLMDRSGEGAAVIERLERALEVARVEQDKDAAREVRLIVAQMRFLQKDVDGALSAYEDSKDYRPFFCQGVIYSLLDRNEEAKDKFSKYHQSYHASSTSTLTSRLPCRGRNSSAPPPETLETIRIRIKIEEMSAAVGRPRAVGDQSDIFVMMIKNVTPSDDRPEEWSTEGVRAGVSKDGERPRSKDRSR